MVDTASQGAPKQVPSVKLNNGIDFPVVGLGTANSVDDKIFTDLIRASLDAGYRHIDTALFYNNHKLIGAALTAIFSEGKYKREDIFITTKFLSQKTKTAVDILKNSLADLNLQYVDLYLIHFPITFASNSTADSEPVILSQPQHIIWAEMEEAYKQKLTRSIGVSNYNVQSIANILSLATVRPAVNQVELHVYNQQPELIKFCRRFNIVVTAYSPLAKGGLPQSLLQNNQVDIFSDPVVNEIAKTHQRSVAQVAINFLHYELGLVVIPKTERIERLAENIEWLSFRLSKEEADKIRGIDQNRRVVKTQLTQFFAWVDYYA